MLSQISLYFNHCFYSSFLLTDVKLQLLPILDLHGNDEMYILTKTFSLKILESQRENTWKTVHLEEYNLAVMKKKCLRNSHINKFSWAWIIVIVDEWICAY